MDKLGAKREEASAKGEKDFINKEVVRRGGQVGILREDNEGDGEGRDVFGSGSSTPAIIRCK